MSVSASDDTIAMISRNFDLFVCYDCFVNEGVGQCKRCEGCNFFLRLVSGMSGFNLAVTSSIF